MLLLILKERDILQRQLNVIYEIVELCQSVSFLLLRKEIMRHKKVVGFLHFEHLRIFRKQRPQQFPIVADVVFVLRPDHLDLRLQLIEHALQLELQLVAHVYLLEIFQLFGLLGLSVGAHVVYLFDQLFMLHRLI